MACQQAQPCTGGQEAACPGATANAQGPAHGDATMGDPDHAKAASGGPCSGGSVPGSGTSLARKEAQGRGQNGAPGNKAGTRDGAEIKVRPKREAARRARGLKGKGEGREGAQEKKAKKKGTKGQQVKRDRRRHSQALGSSRRKDKKRGKSITRSRRGCKGTEDLRPSAGNKSERGRKRGRDDEDENKSGQKGKRPRAASNGQKPKGGAGRTAGGKQKGRQNKSHKQSGGCRLLLRYWPPMFKALGVQRLIRRTGMPVLPSGCRATALCKGRTNIFEPGLPVSCTPSCTAWLLVDVQPPFLC